MHKMERTPKIITIIGLAFEGLAGLSSALMVGLFSAFENSPGFSEMFLEMTPEEIEAYDFIVELVVITLIVFAILFSVMFVINLILFTKLMKGSFTEKQAKKVYLYQAIWGGLSIMINTVTGILYLVSGVQGYNGQVDRIETREGI